MKNILFLCTGNSARSILAEAIMAKHGAGRFNSFSAGSKPKGVPHPAALKLLQSKGYETAHFRSKSWDEFTGPEAAKMDFIFTVCGNAAKETCPVWIGQPMQAHWGIDDPADPTGSEAEVQAEFEVAYQRMKKRIDAFLALPVETMETAELKKRMIVIGDMHD
ncbi:MAG: arsenate reductase ArsC [Aestuariivirga sp.]